MNLASDEYSAAVDQDSLPKNVQYVKVVFWEQGRVVSVHAKRARGLMARYIADKELESIEGVREFSEEGYRFVPSESNETTLVFDRMKVPAKRAAATTTTTATTQPSSTKKAKRKK
jgi:uncharacterized protein